MPGVRVPPGAPTPQCLQSLSQRCVASRRAVGRPLLHARLGAQGPHAGSEADMARSCLASHRRPVQPGRRAELDAPRGRTGFWRRTTRYGLLVGVVDVTAGPVEASAIWLPPNLIRTEEQKRPSGADRGRQRVQRRGASALRRDGPAHGSHPRGRPVRPALASPLYGRGPRAAGSRPRKPAVANRALARRPGRGRVPAVHRAAALAGIYPFGG